MIKYRLIPLSFSSTQPLIFVGNGNRDFGLRVASHFPGCLCDIKIERFSDGEVRIPTINENIRQRDCVIIQTVGITSKGSLNDMLVELMVLIDSIKRASCKSLTVVLPIYPYQRQDRKPCSRSPISASMIAKVLKMQNVNRVICFDLHAGQIQGFFSYDTLLDNLYTESYFINYIKNLEIPFKMPNLKLNLKRKRGVTEPYIQYSYKKVDMNDLIIVSPDEGGVKRATRVAEKLGCQVAFMYKERCKVNQVSKMVLMGDVKDKICFIMDDMVDTAGTLCKAAQILKDNGGIMVYAGACHGVLSGPAITRINKSCIEKLIVSNTLEIEERFGKQEKIDVIDISELCASAIDRSLTGNSISQLISL
tara:strand:+ start:233 stop:1324 length:1092 start_codon:yes stop_codon:yes gene_type:complete